MRAPWLVLCFVVAVVATVVVIALPNSNQADALHAFEAIDIGLAGAIAGVHMPLGGPPPP